MEKTYRLVWRKPIIKTIKADELRKEILINACSDWTPCGSLISQTSSIPEDPFMFR